MKTSKKACNTNDSYDNPLKKSTIESLEYYRHQTEKIAFSLLNNRSILAERADKMLACGSYIELENDTVVGANFCRQRICPMCQRRRSLEVAVKTKEVVNFLSDNFGYKFLHLVLTVPNVGLENLDSTVTKLFRASTKFFKDEKLCKKFKGVMRCLEVTYNSKIGYVDGDCDGCRTIIGKAFHPHLHCLVAVSRSYGSGKNYIKQSELLELWRQYYGDHSINQLHVAAVKDDGAVSEVAKYCVKPLENELPDYELSCVTEAIFSSLHGRRLVQLFGCFKDASRLLKIDFETDLSTPISNGFFVQRYSYDLSQGHYVLSSFAHTT
ncbi:MAG: protein rep [Acutalibacteraceae bacterium]